MVDPTKGGNFTTGNITNVPNLDLGYGAKMSQVSMELSDRLYKVKQLGKENLYGSFIEEYNSKINEFNSKLMYDDNYYKDGAQYGNLTKELGDMYETFKKTAQDQGFTDIEFEDVRNKIKDLDLGVETAFTTKYTEYRENQEKENFLALQIKKAENQNTFMFQGKKDTAEKSFKSSIYDMSKAIDNDYITQPKALEECIKQKGNLISSNVMSALNDPYELERLRNLSFEDFQKEYKNLEFNLKGNHIEISSGDYEIFKKSLNDVDSELQRRAKANELNTKVKAVELEYNLRNKPVEKATETLMMSSYESYSSRLDEVGTLATNFKFGSNYKNLDEIVDDGVLITTIQKDFNDQLSIYTNPNASSVEIMNARAREYREYVNGYSERITENVMNGQYFDYENLPPIGARAVGAYFQRGYTADLYDSIYTASNRQKLENYKDVKLETEDSLAMYQIKNLALNPDRDKRGLDDSTRIALGEEYRLSEYELTMSGKLKGLEIAAKNDGNAEALLKDLKTFLRDTTIIMIEEATGGVVTKDLFLRAGLDKTDIGKPISQLEKQDKLKVIAAFQSEDDFQEGLIRRFEPVYNEMTAGIQTVDLGRGNFCNVSSEVDAEKFAKSIDSLIETGGLHTKNSLTPPSKDIKVQSYIGSDKVIFTFQGEPLYLDGKKCVVDLSNFKKGDNK